MKAKAKLILTLDPTIYVHIREKSTCKDVWGSLKNMYEDNGFSRKISLLRTLISLRYENCSSMEAYVTQVIETSRRLGRTGFKISEEWIGSLLLAGLPEKFAPMIMAIEHSGISVTADEIKTKLLDMETDVDQSGLANALASKANVRKGPKGGASSVEKDRSTKNRKDVVCYRCKQTGHFRNKCPSMQQGNSDDTNKKKQSVSNAFSAAFLSGDFDSEDWYIDSAASNHVTAKKEWMKSMKPANIREIAAANNERLMVNYLGQVDISTVVAGQ